MGKICVTGEYVIKGDHDCIELRENGCLVVLDSEKEITINKLINHKEYRDNEYEYDILVTGINGEDALYGSGLNGEDGHNGGKVDIKVLELDGSIHIKASGGNGGAGGKGMEGPDGGNGGNGGNGGDGAKVDFTYKTSKGTSQAYVHSFHGGFGGKGGSGGICTGSFGLGGKPGEKGTVGGHFGNGGDGGCNGKDAVITIHYPDGSSSINGEECGSEEENTGIRRRRIKLFDFSNDRDFRVFVQKYGGENKLKKYPHIWNALIKTRENRILAHESGKEDAYSNIEIHECISMIEKERVESEEANEICEFYRLKGTIAQYVGNSSGNINELQEAAVPVAYQTIAEIINEDTHEIIYKNTFYSEEDASSFLKEVETDILPGEILLEANFLMKINTAYELKNGELVYSESKQNFKIKGVEKSFIKKVEIMDPHWNPNKDSGNIIFLYGRKPLDNERYIGADYYDENGFYHNNAFQNGILRTIIPIKGKVTFASLNEKKVYDASVGSYHQEEGYIVPFAIKYDLSPESNYIAQFQKGVDVEELRKRLNENKAVEFKEEKDIETSEEMRYAIFDMKYNNDPSISPYDWNCNLAGGFLDDTTHKCYLSGAFPLEIKHDSLIGRTEDTYAITVYSSDYPPKKGAYYCSESGGTTVYIPPIMIYWGCYAQETLIRLDDGRQMRADQILMADRLLGFGGKVLTVIDILVGDDTEIIKITTDDGNFIRVSGGHAMKVYNDTLPEGERVIARELKEGDSLMTIKGTAKITSIVTEAYEGKVYNFIFENESTPNYIEANGYWSGDFYAQNQEDKKEKIEITEEVAALIKECKEAAGTR